MLRNHKKTNNFKRSQQHEQSTHSNPKYCTRGAAGFRQFRPDPTHHMTRRIKLILILAALLGFAVVSAKGAEVEYRVDFKARWAGTAHEGDIEASPRRLFQVFGQPLFNDGDSESLGTYVFTSPDGKVLTVYYRAYDVPQRQIEAQRAAFWRQEQEVVFHIGAKGAHDVPAFKAWLVKRLGSDGM